MKRLFLLLLFVINIADAQTKDISKLSSSQKKEELRETLDWIKTKSGKEFYNRGFRSKTYELIDYDSDNPNELRIQTFFYDTDERVLEYTLDLKNIYKVGIAYDGSSKTVYLETYEGQRLIKYIKANESYITTIIYLNYDNLVNDERILKAFNYAIKLSGGGKKILNEKF